MNKQLKGNLAMASSKTLSGLNENALRYLLPTYVAPITGVLLRVGFGAIAFWIMGLFSKAQQKKAPTKKPPQSATSTTTTTTVGPNPSTKYSRKTLLQIFALGFFLMFGYMIFLLEGLSYTTPVSSAIFISTEPVWVFIICVLFYNERFTWMKVLGIALGLGGAMVCILTQRQSDVASNPLLGNLLCACSSITYSVYLVLSGRFLKTVDKVTVTKWSFLGAAIPAIAMVCITGWTAPVFDCGILSTPMLVLLFVLVFPTCVSYFLVDIGLDCLSTTVVSLYGNVILIVAAVVSYALGQDHFSWWQILAMVMIAASVYYVEIVERKTKNQ